MQEYPKKDLRPQIIVLILIIIIVSLLKKH